MTLYSLGHSTKTFDEFVELITSAKITTLVDIRRFPRSRRHPHFARERLEERLEIDYLWLGDELGGFREPDYETWMRTPDFERGIVRLEELAREGAVVGFMCSEGRPEKCHRRFVAERLASRSNDVWHLLPDGSREPVTARLDL